MRKENKRNRLIAIYILKWKIVETNIAGVGGHYIHLCHLQSSTHPKNIIMFLFTVVGFDNKSTVLDFDK